MPTRKSKSKPSNSANQKAGRGCPPQTAPKSPPAETACSPPSDTPETDAFEAAQHSSLRFPRVLEKMRKLERERNQLRYDVILKLMAHGVSWAVIADAFGVPRYYVARLGSKISSANA
jgi:hypothetical protein